MTQQLSNGQTLNIMEVKYEVAEIKRMVAELYDRPIISKTEVTTIPTYFYVNNIWAIPNTVDETQQVIEENREEKKERKKRKHAKKMKL